MSEKTLELPHYALIPYEVQIDKKLSDAEKLYYGQIYNLGIKEGYMWATDEQLAEMKGVGIRTIERYNRNLENAGHLYRETKNYHIRHGDTFVWEKRRRIYFNKKAKEKYKNDPENQNSNNFTETAKSGGSPGKENSKNVCGTAIFGGSYGPAKNGGINITILKEQDDTLVYTKDIPTTTTIAKGTLREPEPPSAGFGGGGAEKKEFELKNKKSTISPCIYFTNARGVKVEVSESDIFRHFLKSNFTTDTVTQAIEEAKKNQEIVNSPMKYLEAICFRIMKNKDAPKNNNTQSVKPQLEERPMDKSPRVSGSKYNWSLGSR